jgi:hypothetical protein
MTPIKSPVTIFRVPRDGFERVNSVVDLSFVHALSARRMDAVIVQIEIEEDWLTGIGSVVMCPHSLPG